MTGYSAAWLDHLFCILCDMAGSLWLDRSLHGCFLRGMVEYILWYGWILSGMVGSSLLHPPPYRLDCHGLIIRGMAGSS